MRGVESQPLLDALPPLPSATPLPQLHCGDNGGSMLISNLVELNYEIQVLVAVGEGVDAIREDVPLVVEGTQTSLQIL